MTEGVPANPWSSARDSGTPPTPGTILVAGTLALDSVESEAGSVTEVLGGSALYFAAAAARWSDDPDTPRPDPRDNPDPNRSDPPGPDRNAPPQIAPLAPIAPIALVGIAGSDFPLAECRWLEERGVDFSGLRTVDGPSFRWSVRYQGEERETLATNRGVTLTELPEVPPTLRSPWAVFLGSTNPHTQTAVLDSLTGDPLVALDTMAHWIEDERPALDALIARSHILLVNEEEAELLGGAEVLLNRLSTRHDGSPWVVVKRGRAGATAHGSGVELHVPAVAGVRMIDPTGAGDAFAGGMLGSLARLGGRTPTLMEPALAEGARMGALAVSGFSLAGFGPGMGFQAD